MKNEDRPAPAWFKSSYSGSQGGNCLEVAGAGSCPVAVRDSKDVVRGHLTIAARSWDALVRDLKD
ncbi:DUF397 domain-containing protein [Yinghuangia soli]|uniref:DUF397 domain-containing protein n=1 Tax=Yinghuangia soli TaxID=2908204 RepID=A0AA41TXZ1_9ACTN|nr:DUF397 domain-containing protein [Yinghuangia soli]MCF2527323.1 DUF397 domain-containing protein [Yinghuangia soli]